jgi:hypothetical protein
MKRNHFDTFPVILVFYGTFYWRIYLCFLLFNSSLQQIFWHCPFFPMYIWLSIIGDGSITILSIDTISHAATNSINPSIKNFSFLTKSRYLSSFRKNLFSSIESNHQLKFFSSSKDHRSNQCFYYSESIIGINPINVFFHHRCPSMDSGHF